MLNGYKLYHIMVNKWWISDFIPKKTKNLNFKPLKQSNAWMTSQIFTLEIQRLSHYCNEHYPGEIFDLG